MTKFLTQQILDERAQKYAQLSEAKSIELDQWLVFRLEEEYFTLNIESLDEMANFQSGAALMSHHAHLLGLVSVRGVPTPLFDLGSILGLRHMLVPSDQLCILVVHAEKDDLLGLLVDEVVTLSAFADDDFQTYSLNNNKIRSTFIQAITDYQGHEIAQLRVEAILQAI